MRTDCPEAKGLLVMARYGLFVLKVPLNPNQPTYGLVKFSSVISSVHFQPCYKVQINSEKAETENK